jgi:hypothetical protein
LTSAPDFGLYGDSSGSSLNRDSHRIPTKGGSVQA